jgi:hypothetical protein
LSPAMPSTMPQPANFCKHDASGQLIHAGDSLPFGSMALDRLYLKGAFKKRGE